MKHKLPNIVGAAAIIAALVAAPAALAAAVSFTFEASGFARPGTVAPGDTLTLATVDVPTDLIGDTCVFTGTTTNGESVHVNNYAEIVTNGNSSDVLGTEDGVNGVHLVDRTLTLGESITVLYHVGGRARGELPVGVSVDMEFTVTCQDITTTTSTTTSSSTTTPSTSVPPPSSSTTTTTTDTSSTTAAPPTTVPTESTTTTNPTGPPSTTIPPVAPPSTLPFTGIDTATAAGLGVSLLAAGVLGLYASRARGRHEVR